METGKHNPNFKEFYTLLTRLGKLHPEVYLGERIRIVTGRKVHPLKNPYKAGDEVLCTNPNGHDDRLTAGKIYTVIDKVSETVGIIDDTGEYETHGMARFVLAIAGFVVVEN